MIIRKCKKGELNQILSCANSAFKEVRYPEFDFRINMAKIYSSKIDYSPSHFCIIEDQKMVSVGGNILKEINLDKPYLVSFVGSIATLKEYQNRGYMSLLMKNINSENVSQKVIFSILTGDRTRYNHFGYEKVGYDYNFTILNKRLPLKTEISCLELQESDDDIEALYSQYLKQDLYKLKTKDDFYKSLIGGRRKPYILKQDDKVYGYFTKKEHLDNIDEFVIFDINKLPLIIKSIFNYFNKELTISVSSLDRDLFYRFSLLSENISLQDDLLIKVYDEIEFLKFLFSINKNIMTFENKTYVYQIGDERLLIKINNNSIDISKTSETPIKTFPSMMEFNRYILSLESLYDLNSLHFFFSFNKSDLF